MSDHGEHGEEAPAPPFGTPEFKAEIIELCQQGDRSVGQVAKDFGLTETAVREWVKQAERDTRSRQDGGLTGTERRELAELRRENRRLREDVKSRSGRRLSSRRRPGERVSVHEAEKAGSRNVKRACELLKVSRAAYCRARDGESSQRDRQDADLTATIRAGRRMRQVASTAWPGSDGSAAWLGMPALTPRLRLLCTRS
jgi:transposase